MRRVREQRPPRSLSSAVALITSFHSQSVLIRIALIVDAGWFELACWCCCACSPRGFGPTPLHCTRAESCECALLALRAPDTQVVFAGCGHSGRSLGSHRSASSAGHRPFVTSASARSASAATMSGKPAATNRSATSGDKTRPPAASTAAAASTLSKPAARTGSSHMDDRSAGARRVRFQDGVSNSPSVSVSRSMLELGDIDPTARGAALPPLATALSSSASASASASPPATHTDEADARRAALLLADFAAPEVVPDTDEETSVSGRRSQSASTLHASATAAAGNDSDGGLEAFTATQHTTTSSHPQASPERGGGGAGAGASEFIAAPTYAEAPNKHVSYVLPPPSHPRSVSQDSSGDYPQHEREDSAGSHHAGFSPHQIQQAMQRTPSPQPPTIIAFSSRLKGSSVLFAPPNLRGRSSSFGAAASSLGSRDISPTDFRHHSLANNAAVAASLYPPHTPPSLSLPLPASAAQPFVLTVQAPDARQRQSSGGSRNHSSEWVQPPRDINTAATAGVSTAAEAASPYHHLHIVATPSATQPAITPELLLRSRDLAPLRDDPGVGHAMLSGSGSEHRSRFDSSSSREDDSRVRRSPHPVHARADSISLVGVPEVGSPRRAYLGDADQFAVSASEDPLNPRRSPARSSPPPESALPLYTRTLRLFLIAVGVVRYMSDERTKLAVQHIHRFDAEDPEAGGGVAGGREAGSRDEEEDGRSPSSATALARSNHDRAEEVPMSRPVTSAVARSNPRPRSIVAAAAAAGWRRRGSWCSQLHAYYVRARSWVYPAMVFLFIFTNVFFVTVSNNAAEGEDSSVLSSSTSRSYNQGVWLASDFCMNMAPLVSWVGAFYFIGYSDDRASLVFFEQLSNLESYNRKVLRNYLVGAAIAGLILMATTNLTDVSGAGAATSRSFFSLLNVGLFVLLNYLITTFVICALASLVAIFHYYSLVIFQEQMYSQSLSVVEAIREHIVLMRLQRESAKYLQYIIFPPLLLYVTGALLAGYNMLSSSDYSHLSATAFQLILAFVTLMVSGCTRRHDRRGTTRRARTGLSIAHTLCRSVLLFFSATVSPDPSGVRCSNHSNLR